MIVQLYITNVKYSHRLNLPSALEAALPAQYHNQLGGDSGQRRTLAQLLVDTFFGICCNLSRSNKKNYSKEHQI